MSSRTIRHLFLAVVLTVFGVVMLGKVRLGRDIASRVDTLLLAATPSPSKKYHSTDIRELPEPVTRYFDAVLEEGQEHVRSVQLEQRGEFRMGGRSGSWKPMRATQDYTTSPPGFVWDATIEVVPFIPARVVDAYERGKGSLRARVLSTIPVATADSSPEMDEGELLRYLGEAVWFPTALLPTAGVGWEPSDDHSARATIKDCGNTASLVFHFDDYQWHDGLCIPMKASVEWHLPSGDLSYWRARLTAITYRT